MPARKTVYFYFHKHILLSMRSHEKHRDKFPGDGEVLQSIDRYQERKEAEQVRDAMQQILFGI